MADNLEDQILENALAPKKIEVDGRIVEEHDLDDLIKADKYLRSKAAGFGGFKISKFSAPSAVGDR